VFPSHHQTAAFFGRCQSLEPLYPLPPLLRQWSNAYAGNGAFLSPPRLGDQRSKRNNLAGSQLFLIQK